MGDSKKTSKGKYIPMKKLEGCGGAWGNPRRVPDRHTQTYRCTKCGQTHN